MVRTKQNKNKQKQMWSSENNDIKKRTSQNAY